MLETKIDIIVVGETWLNDDISDLYQIPGFKIELVEA
jgi:hypothetical protein